MEFRIYYPSGARLKLEGRFGIYVSEDRGIGSVPFVEVSEKDVVMLDPRCVCISSDEERCESYFPSKNTGLAGWAKEWLEEHPEWPVGIK